MLDSSFTLPSYAKINLTLRVLGRRTDGYHELLTVFQTVTLCDLLRFKALKDERLEITCSAPGIPTGERNLVYRAAIALRHRYGVRRGALIELEKHIPAGGGLGGGSSNAAVALLGLAYLWDIETNKQELTEIGAQLGADVPFFFTGGTALGTGLGTEISALEEITAEHLLIVTPGVNVSTAEAYAALRAPALTKAESAVMLPSSCADAQISDLHNSVLRNDFEPVVFRLWPEIARARNMLLKLGAHGVLLSGSGSSVFGFFDKIEEREQACEMLKVEDNWSIFACATLARSEYRKALRACAAVL